MGMLDGKVSQDDVNRVDGIRHHPDIEPGFDGSSSGGGDGLDDYFGGGGGGSDSSDDLNSLFSGGGDSGFGGSSGGFGGSSGGFGGAQGGFGGQASGGFGGAQGGFGGFGQQQGGFGGFGQQGGFGGFGQQQQPQQPAQPDALDKMLDASGEAAKTTGQILIDMFKSIKLRTSDDIGYLGRNLMLTGIIMAPAGLLLSIIGSTTGIKFLTFGSFGSQVFFCGCLSAAVGVINLGVGALILCKKGEQEESTDTLDNIPDIQTQDNATDDFENNQDGILDDIFSTDIDSMLNSVETDTAESEPTDTSDSYEDEDEEVSEPMDFASVLEGIHENAYLNRQTLFDTFKPMFATCTSDFSTKTKIEVDSEDFKTLETICLKALSNISNTQLEELNSSLESATETIFSYELRLKRINKVKNTDELAREIENYMRDSEDDDSVNASVSITGDFYKIVVTKGVTKIVTFGDIFKFKKYCEYFKDNKHKLPFISGIGELGDVYLDDARIYPSMLIAGKPRSGKSWYVLSIIMSMMLFNTPDDVQFLIIDPKKSNLFKKVSFMPHVCGLHDDKNIIDILNDVIKLEAPRRKKMLEDAECDDIWAIRESGVKLPFLYIVIDEYITVVNNLEAEDKEKKKEFDAQIQTVLSQFPSLGIGLIIIPHRSVAVLSKTNRGLIQFYASVRGDNEDILDTLGIKKWTRALTKPGDIALRTTAIKTPVYVRGAALTTSDGDNAKFIETAAKAFYKMGVEVPSDMQVMQIACNRDPEHVKNELMGKNRIEQYSADSVKKELDNV